MLTPHKVQAQEADAVSDMDFEEDAMEDEDEEDDDDQSVAEDFESASDDSGEEDGEDGESEVLVQTRHKRPAKKSPAAKELPYTFPCPETHDEFLEIVEDIKDEDVPTVVKRIRALHHPSLAEDNKFKLQASDVWPLISGCL